MPCRGWSVCPTFSVRCRPRQVAAAAGSIVLADEIDKLTPAPDGILGLDRNSLWLRATAAFSGVVGLQRPAQQARVAPLEMAPLVAHWEGVTERLGFAVNEQQGPSTPSTGFMGERQGSIISACVLGGWCGGGRGVNNRARVQGGVGLGARRWGSAAGAGADGSGLGFGTQALAASVVG